MGFFCDEWGFFVTAELMPNYKVVGEISAGVAI
jgi:hypothetical protein